MEQLAHTISEACAIARIGRTSMYAAIKSGHLLARKYGRRRLILNRDLRRWLEALPASKANANGEHPQELPGPDDEGKAHV